MRQLALKLAVAKESYDAGGRPLDEICNISKYCITSLAKNSRQRAQASLGSKHYHVFLSKANVSRPILTDLFITTPKEFIANWTELIASCNSTTHRITLTPAKINKTLYTSIMAFSACYDLWQPSSRKTPGTYFEVLLGSILGMLLPNCVRSKHIPIPNSEENVSTDIVFTNSQNGNGLVIPVKITTRERIVQPFAHQRILDSVFGIDRFHSILVCASELQRDGDDNVNEICVPGTIKLFQSHLAKLKAIYYLDPPTRYLAGDVLQVIKIDSLGTLLAQDLPDFIS